MLARRWALVLAAVGAGFVVALLLQEPAAADGRRDAAGGERHQQAGVLVERVVRFAQGEAPERRRQQVVTVGDVRLDAPTRISKVVSPAGVRPPTPSAGSVGVGRSSRSAALPRVDPDVARGVDPDVAQRRERLPRSRSETAAGTRHRPATIPAPPSTGALPPAAGSPDHTAVGVGSVRHLLSAALPVVSSTVGMVVDRSSHAVRVVLRATVGPVVAVLGRVVDAGLGDVVVPASPRRPAPVPLTPGWAPVTVSDAPGGVVPALVGMMPVHPTFVPVRAVVPPATPMSVSAVEAVSGVVSVGRGAGWSGSVPAPAGTPVWPVAPPDQDAAGASDRSAPGSGAVLPTARPSATCSEQVFDVAPLVVGVGFSSVNARPG
ncbi:hypothetical protein [Micromonospora sp. B9E7]|uniref:hypothetical protein n=1 Tax=Micromonospora sp. B9E7 TaxID=3153574 RepID=UPI00325D82A6